MQVYKVFFQILNKQQGMIIMYLSIFMSIAFAVSSQSASDKQATFERSAYTFSVFDEDKSVVSSNLISYLANENERVIIEDNEESINDELYNRVTSCVIRIPKGFGESLEEGGELKQLELTAIPGTVYGETFKNLTNRYISTVKGYMAGGFATRMALAKAELALSVKAETTLEGESSTMSYSRMYYFFSYFPYIFTCICLVAIGPILLIFRKKDVRDRIYCSAYSQLRTNMELFAGMATTGIGLCVIYFLLCTSGSAGATMSFGGFLNALNMFCFMIVAMGIVFVTTQFVKGKASLSVVSNVLGLGMAFLSGIFVPLELLGDGIVKAAHVLPSYWYIVAAREIDGYKAGGDMSQMFIGMGVQLLFGAALICVGLAVSKAKMKNAAANA